MLGVSLANCRSHAPTRHGCGMGAAWGAGQSEGCENVGMNGSRRRWRRATAELACALAIGGVVAVVLAGCAAPATPFGSGSATPSSTPTATTVPSATATPTPTSTGQGECNPNQLALSLQARPGDSGAGNFFWDLQFTNTSSAECSLKGYPAVSLVSANSGEAIGAVSENEPGRFFPEAVVPLAPGASAYSLLHLTQAGAYGCTIVPVTEVAVTPPQWEASRRVATPGPIDGCDDHSTVIVRAGPIAPARVTF